MLLMTQAFLLFAEETEEASGVDLLFPDPNETIAGVIAFVIVFFFVWKWAIPALNKTLEARQAAIAAELESAEKAKLEAESLLADYRAQVAGANEEAAQKVADGRDAGEAVKADIIARAEAEARLAPLPSRSGTPRCRCRGREREL